MNSNPLWPESTPTGRCSDCAWMYRGGRGRAVPRCRRHHQQRVDPEWVGCGAFTAELNCLDCGACCREAYDTVEVSRRDPFRKKHPETLIELDGRLNIRRSGPNCINLGCGDQRWACQVYTDRPKTCRDFERGGINCVDARRRLGLTP